MCFWKPGFVFNNSIAVVSITKFLQTKNWVLPNCHVESCALYLNTFVQIWNASYSLLCDNWWKSYQFLKLAEISKDTHWAWITPFLSLHLPLTHFLANCGLGTFKGLIWKTFGHTLKLLGTFFFSLGTFERSIWSKAHFKGTLQVSLLSFFKTPPDTKRFWKTS
jgi:hypothetical protein